MPRTDNDTWDLATSVGATATMVAAARAVATKADNPLINDQFAEPLVRAVGVDFLTKWATGDLDAADIDVYSKLSRSEIGRMLQAVLNERFGLKAHHESRVLPVYPLVIAKAGPTIKEAKPGDPSNEPEGMPKIPSGIVRRERTREEQKQGTLQPYPSKMPLVVL